MPNFIGRLEIFNSRPDTYGNCYWAFRYTSLENDKSAFGTISGSRSNIMGILFEMNGGSWEPHNVITTENELKIREFNRMVKTWPYAGCSPEDLAEFVRQGIK